MLNNTASAKYLPPIVGKVPSRRPAAIAGPVVEDCMVTRTPRVVVGTVAISLFIPVASFKGEPARTARTERARLSDAVSRNTIHFMEMSCGSDPAVEPGGNAARSAGAANAVVHPQG